MKLHPPSQDEPYGRTMLSAPDAAYEVIAMQWRHRARCAPHDHGAAEGCIHVVTGRFVERRYSFEAGALTMVATLTHDAPALVDVVPHVIHDMEAVEGGLTIHRYAPHIQGMRVWDIAARETLVVRDDCGAWVPTDKALIVSRQPWSAP